MLYAGNNLPGPPPSSRFKKASASEASPTISLRPAERVQLTHGGVAYEAFAEAGMVSRTRTTVKSSAKPGTVERGRIRAPPGRSSARRPRIATWSRGKVTTSPAGSPLEIDDSGRVRIESIVESIGECRYGTHDISRTELDTGNEPPYRYQKFISDIAGQDIKSHDGDFRKSPSGGRATGSGAPRPSPAPRSPDLISDDRRALPAVLRGTPGVVPEVPPRPGRPDLQRLRGLRLRVAQGERLAACGMSRLVRGAVFGKRGQGDGADASKEHGREYTAVSKNVRDRMLAGVRWHSTSGSRRS